MKNYRRTFLREVSLGLVGLGAISTFGCTPKKSVNDMAQKEKELFFKISLAQWSLHKSIEKKTEDPSLFPLTARQ